MNDKTTLPAMLLAAAEAHPCFSGCYRLEPRTTVVANSGMVDVVHVCCEDCLAFRIGLPASEISRVMGDYMLALALTAHVRVQRGYRWAVSGFHKYGDGFWLSAAYYGEGLFLVDSSRNGGSLTDVDYLVLGLKHVPEIRIDDARMLDPALYRQRAGYTRVPLAAPWNLDGYLSTVPVEGGCRVAVVEFVPLRPDELARMTGESLVAAFERAGAANNESESDCREALAALRGELRRRLAAGLPRSKPAAP